jgi:hypothetical protein
VGKIKAVRRFTEGINLFLAHLMNRTTIPRLSSPRIAIVPTEQPQPPNVTKSSHFRLEQILSNSLISEETL